MNVFKRLRAAWKALIGRSEIAAPVSKPLGAPIPVKQTFWQRLLGGEKLPTTDTRREYEIPKPFPGVVPAEYKDRKPALAYDSALTEFGAGSLAFGYGGWDQAGFLGYAFLAELSQITEFRRPAEILANEMTRKWGKIVSSSDDPAVKKKIKELTDDLKKFKVKEVFNRAFELDNFFGIGHIFIDVGATETDLKTPLLMDAAKIAPNSLKGFRTVEPMWTYPNLYNASNPLNPDFYDPSTWFVLGNEVERSRLLRFISRPMPDMLKPPYLFGGISLTQLLQPYVDNWLRTRGSVSSIISNYSTPVFKTDMDQTTQKGGFAGLALRAQLYNETRNNNGLMICDNDKENFEIVAAPIAGLSELQAQSIEQMAFPGGIPLVKLLGVTPSGLNASSDGEVRVFYDSIASLQERIGTPNIKRALDVMQMNRYGTIDPGIGWEWEQLWELNEEQAATVRKTEAETDVIYVEAGIIDPKAVLDTLIADPESRYAGIDLQLPDPGMEGDFDDESGEEPLDLKKLMGPVSAGTIVGSEEKSRDDRGRDPDDRTGRTARPAETARPAQTAGERARDKTENSNRR